MANVKQSQYSLTPAIWPQKGIIEIFDQSGDRIVGFSVEFLERGEVLNWAYITFCVQSSVIEAGKFVNQSGADVDYSQIPTAARYFFVKDGR